MLVVFPGNVEVPGRTGVELPGTHRTSPVELIDRDGNDLAPLEPDRVTGGTQPAAYLNVLLERDDQVVVHRERNHAPGRRVPQHLLHGHLETSLLLLERRPALD